MGCYCVKLVERYTMKTADAADAKFLGGIGVVLAAATLMTGIVLVSSLPPRHNILVAETIQPAAMSVIYGQNVLQFFHAPNYTNGLPHLIADLDNSRIQFRD
jgi:hypothetical protein